MVQPSRIVTKERATLEEAIHKTFPQRSFSELRFVETGWQCIVVIADDALVFRFPRSRENESDLKMELRLLPVLARRLPCKIPVPMTVRPPLTTNGMPFMVYKKVSGSSANWNVLSPEERSSLLGDLKAVLDALARFPLNYAMRAGVEDHRSPAWMREIESYYKGPLSREALPALRREPQQKVHKFFREYLGNPKNADFRPILLHRELNPGHVLLSSGRVTGIIDWGAMWVGDPAYDLGELACALNLTDGELRRIGRERIAPKDETFCERVRFYTVFASVSKLHGAVRREDPVGVEAAGRLLANV